VVNDPEPEPLVVADVALEAGLEECVDSRDPSCLEAVSDQGATDAAPLP